MGETSGIAWTDATFNPWIGCTNVSPGCDHCYAEAWSTRFGLVRWGNHERRRTSAAYWQAPLKWNANAEAFERKHGRRRRVFCASLADTFDNQVPTEWRADLWTLIRDTPRLDWLILTKRPQNIRRMLPDDWGDGWANVWLGATAEDEQHYRQRWPVLSDVPAVIRFISYEPAIGPLGPLDTNGLVPDWLIFGGESGAAARPTDPAWARRTLNQCRKHGTAFLLKQWGTWQNNPLCVEQGLQTKQAKQLDPHGKGGKMLDGQIYHQYPQEGDQP